MAGAKTYRVFEKPIDVRVRNDASGAERTVRALALFKGRFEVSWSLCDRYMFNASDGRGEGMALGWTIVLDDLRMLRGDPEYKPPPVGGKERRSGPVPKAHPRQLKLI